MPGVGYDIIIAITAAYFGAIAVVLWAAHRWVNHLRGYDGGDQ